MINKHAAWQDQPDGAPERGVDGFTCYVNQRSPIGQVDLPRPKPPNTVSTDHSLTAEKCPR